MADLFQVANMRRGDRRNMIALALQKVQCDLYLKVLVMLVFEATSGGSGAMQRSYRELGSRPYGLCCGKTKTRGTVKAAKKFGLLSVEPMFLDNGGQRSNRYSINWTGVKSLIDSPVDHEGHRTSKADRKRGK